MIPIPRLKNKVMRSTLRKDIKKRVSVFLTETETFENQLSRLRLRFLNSVSVLRLRLRNSLSMRLRLGDEQFFKLTLRLAPRC